MTGVRAKIEAELEALTKAGFDILKDFPKPEARLTTSTKYQLWYTQALAAVRQLLPDRLEEFETLYHLPGRRTQKDFSLLSYGIEDYLLGLRVQTTQRHGEPKDAFDHEVVAAEKLRRQVMILGSAITRLTDILSNLRGVLQAELFDTELDAARELLKTGHLRAAGAVAGVVLERHLSSVAALHSVAVHKKNPSASDWNDALKEGGVVDIPDWRKVQRLTDLRNVCCHDKKREPTADDVRELIDGTDKLTKTLV